VKKAKIILITLAIVGCLALMILACMSTLIVKREKEEIPVKKWFASYLVDETKGTITGNVHQDVEDGKDATEVCVVPALGYRFVKWKDTGSTDPKRQDLNVHNMILGIAIIEGPETCYQSFYAGEGGTLVGDLRQEIPYGGESTTVTAVPDAGYRFLRWSDGDVNPVRKNEKVSNRFEEKFYAEFVRHERTFELEYNGATCGNDKKEVLITEDNMTDMVLPVPQRENCAFEGWYSDWHLTMQVSDEEGKIVAGKEWFNNEKFHGNKGHDRVNKGGKLYAKWRAINTIPTYRILMIFVTEIHTELTGKDGEIIKVDYVMSDFERKYCNQIAKYVAQYLNAIFNATLNFEVDSYFTEQPIKNIRYNYTLGIVNIKEEIPEAADMVDNYRSVLTVFSMNGHGTSAVVAKYACINLDSITYIKNEDENLFDLSYPTTYVWWESDTEIYLRELTYSVEMQLTNEDRDANYGLHAVGSMYADRHGGIFRTYFDVLGDYLTCNFDVDGKKVGIPYEFWTGEYFKDKDSE